MRIFSGMRKLNPTAIAKIEQKMYEYSNERPKTFVSGKTKALEALGIGLQVHGPC